ncbi:RidA family protein [Serratia fonticola]
MITRMASHCGDNTCPSCVIAGDFIFLAHHAGGHEKIDIEHQVRASFNSLQKTLASVESSLDNLVQVNLFLKDCADFDKARNIFYEYFDENSFPVRMTLVTEFVGKNCLCMLDGVAYKPRNCSA